ncbi:MAG TPA: ABC transporter ATP-binding protein [Micromonosporaceae bacterium]|nr:ABC transporter ATP-binding protein [Micromonosporaceae bacterium]
MGAPVPSTAARRRPGEEFALPETTLLAVSGIRREFGGVVVVDDVTFTVSGGEAVAVVGPNGSGKTTLLRCVVGADRADAGHVSFAGRRMSETDPWVRASVAAALDDLEFFPDLSVAEHLSLLAYAHGTPDVDAVDAVIVDLGLDGVRDQLPPTLSSGQRRRLALASCFVRPRRLLVLDEPEQRLDTDGRRWLVDKLLAEKAAGTAVLFASHDDEIVSRVADVRVDLER